MANEENIRDFRFGSEVKRTASEQRELKSLGGKASGEARRRKRDAQKIMGAILTSKPELDQETRRNLTKMGIRGEGRDGRYDLELLTAAAIVQKAMRGDVRAYRLILEIMGEDAATKRERERMAHERKMAELLNAVPDVVDDGFIEALTGIHAFDGNEDIPLDLMDGDENDPGSDQ